MKKNTARRYTKPVSLYRVVSRPIPLAMAMGMSRNMGIGKNTSTPMKLNRKCAMAMVMALDELEFRMAAMKAVTVVPMFAPRINGTALRSVIIFCATIGTTTDVVMVLERMAAVVANPQKNDLNVFLKKKRLNFSGELAMSKPEISLRNNRIETNNKATESSASKNPLGMVFTKNSITGLNPRKVGEKEPDGVVLLMVKKFSAIQPAKLDRIPL